MGTAITLTPEQALEAIASAPDAAGKTPADLRDAADLYEADAERKDRLVAGRGNTHASRRAAARAKSRERKGDRLRLHADVCRSAAEEIERRGCSTVGEATKSAVVRAMRKALRMQDGGER